MDAAELLERARYYRSLAERAGELLYLAEQYAALAREIDQRQTTMISDGAMIEDPLAKAQRHVLECERRVAEQIDRIVRMKADGDSERGIATAEEVLATPRRTLELSREHLEFERARSSGQ